MNDAAAQRLTVAVPGAELAVTIRGEGPVVVVLSGGPGCVHYLDEEHLSPPGLRAAYPEPRGVGRLTGGPHDMATAIADLEAVRVALALDDWVVVGHSWGSDLALRYAIDHPGAVRGVVGIAGHGVHRDRDWSQAYEEGLALRPETPVAYDEAVHAALGVSFRDWIHSPSVLADLAGLRVPVLLLAAELDVRPDWPLRQLAALIPDASFDVIEGVPHDLFATHPDVWRRTVDAGVGRVTRRSGG